MPTKLATMVHIHQVLRVRGAMEVILAHVPTDRLPADGDTLYKSSLPPEGMAKCGDSLAV